PPQSLFPDGRYAHLWKTYRPPSEVAAAEQSEQDVLRSITAACNSRKSALGQAALENCIEEQLAERECWERGSAWERLTACREPSARFNRCYNMQQRFLKALGFLSTTIDADQEERIQMHADKLYHEMLAREAASASDLPPLLTPESIRKALGDNSPWERARKKAIEMGEADTTFTNLPPDQQDAIRKRLEGMSETEKQVELQLLVAEGRAHLEHAEPVREWYAEEKRAREERRMAGKETFGDRVKNL
ncbi:hypothetical protein K470DRAFT_195044, partial [Piedraia hortae CBS 480.64]